MDRYQGVIKMKHLLFVLCSLACALSAAEIKEYDVRSESMKKDIKVNVILPDSYAKEPERRYPVIYLLHGCGDDHKDWVRKGGSVVPEAADRKNIIIICPDGKKSWYYDSPVNPASKYETFCAEELVAWTDSAFRTKAERSGRAVCGHSMGGHGALWLGIRHKDTFSAAIGLSAGVDVRPFPEYWNLPALLGEQKSNMENWETHTVIHAAKSLKNGELAIAVDCGAGDFFFNVNKNLHELLTQMKVDHDYTIRPGHHNWSYWRNAFPHAVLFAETQFKKAK